MCASCGCDGGLKQDTLEKNDQLAASNRALLARRHIAAFNLMGGPGSGKTTLLEALVHRVCDRIPMAVIEGDQETDRDAARIRAARCPVVQINTRTSGHLDAQMVKVALVALNPPDRSLLLIENVGNLVCPALFDLGERAKMVVMSVTEGEDTPLKYPHVFRAARVLVLTKIDLLPYLDFDIDACLANAFRVNPDLRVFAVSPKDGFGMANLCHWLTGAATVPAELADEAQEYWR
ncbi:MAG TPA: hydrogenase nickel incorporation protein HypB [Polyangia bacterium]|nr:hydrogenase nickel incorporation protein HypB [Polyangia bacterium]